MAGCQVTPSSSSEVVAESGWNVRCPDEKFCHLAGPGRHHPVTVTEGHQHLQRGQYYSPLQLCSTQAASIFPECWGNIRILKLWFENYFSKGKFIGEVFLSHSASTLLWLPEWCLAIEFYLLELVLLYLYLRWKTLGPSLPITVMTWANLISWGAMSVQSKKRK